MNNELCIKITPRRTLIAGFLATVFGVAATLSPFVIGIGITAFLVGCISWNVYFLRSLNKLRVGQIDI